MPQHITYGWGLDGDDQYTATLFLLIHFLFRSPFIYLIIRL